MRIRRRPSLQQASSSDPATFGSSPSFALQNAARNNRGCLERDDDYDDVGRPDLGGQRPGVARRLALPQENAVDAGVSAGAGRGAGDGVHVRCTSTVDENGWDQKDCTGAVGDKPEPAAKVEEEHAGNGALRLAAAANVEEKVITSNGSVGVGASKKRRGPAVLLEGSRCSRVNGRGWRCSQPTLVGYSLCEHHLGKGRSRSGSGQLGRTERRARARGLPASAGAVTVVATPAPSADGRPGMSRC